MPGVDYDALAQKYGGTAAVQPPDYDALAQKYGGSAAQTPAAPAPVISRNPRTGLPQTLNDVTGIPTAGAVVGGAAGSLVGLPTEGAAIGAGAGKTADEMIHGTPAGDAAWLGVKNALWTEVGGRAISLAAKFGAPVLQKIADVLDEYEFKLPKNPSPNPLSYIERKPAGMSGSPSAEDLARARFQNVGYKPSASLAPKPGPTPTPMPVGTPTNVPNTFTAQLPAPGSVPQPQLAPPATLKPLIPFGGTSTAAPSSFQGALPPVPAENPSQAIQAIPKAAQEPMTKGRVLFVPMKSPGAAPESAKPGDLWTIPRDKLIDLAKAGDSNAVAILQRLGHKVVYVPSPAE